MSSHTSCTHAASPAARRTCRTGRQVVEMATTKLGLVAEHTSTSTVMQIKFYRPDEDAFWRTTVSWTTPYEGGDNLVSVYQATSTNRVKGLPRLRSWLRTIGREG